MKLIIALAFILSALAVLAVYDAGQAARARAEKPLIFGCRAPSAEGEFAFITISVVHGQLVAGCQYASARVPNFQGK